GRTAEARLALAPLVVLGEATEDEERTVRAKRSPAPRPGSFDSNALRSLAVDSCLGAAATGVLVSLSSAFPRLFPGNLERFGLSRRDRISPRAPHASRSLADEMAGVFGVQDYDLYEHRSASPLISIEAFDPVAVVVSARVAKLPEALQRFLLAR